MKLERITHSEEETLSLGESLGRTLRRGDVVALIGELGAGKTRLVRGVARGMGIDPAMVSSPTYVLVNEYEPEAPANPTLIHVDAYRLFGAHELASLGWSSPQDHSAVVVIEWADRITAELPPEALTITIEHVADPTGTTRRIVLSGLDEWTSRLTELGCRDERAGDNAES